ncbi:MAG TPA: GDP-mannose 4,6-dehydratase [Verrucomicrobiae bacterium]|nr:GDP-mannose 4,6-dehydratase [Verrucomicrobiae bacterium]
MDRKVLVTGGAGFIGSHLCGRLLDEGLRVVSFDNFNPFYDPSIKKRNIAALLSRPDRENFISIEGDIRDSETLFRVFAHEKPDAVVHLAAMAGVRPSIKDPVLYTEVNVTGTQNVLEACVEQGIRHLLFASSSSVYGNNLKVPFSETDPVDHPISPYAATKKAGELMCHTYAHLYGMAIYCLRFFTVYGPGQRPDLAIYKFAKLMLEDAEIPFYGDGATQRDYTYVEDIVDGIVKALDRNFSEAKKSYHVLNLGGSQTVTLTQMVETLEQALGRRARLKRLPQQPGDVEKTYADISKARDMLGFSPATPFAEGIRKFAAWYQALRKEEGIAA